MISRPVFLVGAERSGTTLLRLMLDHHPLVSFFSEFEFSVDIIADDGAFPRPEDYYDFLSTNRPYLTSGFSIDSSLEYRMLVNDFLCQKRDRDGKVLVGATVHRHFNRLLLVWPNARFIHLFRDPRDVAKSNIAMGWAGNTWTGADRWVEAERLWDCMASRLPKQDQIDVCYENLVADPSQVLLQICVFLGIPYRDEMLNYYKDSNYSPPDVGNIGRWRREAAVIDIQLVEARVGELLEKRGYPASGLEPLSVTPQQDFRLRRQCRWSRRRFAIQRFGPMLVAASFLSRRLPFRQWKKRVQLRMNDIINSHVK